MIFNWAIFRHCERSAAIQTVHRFVDCRVAALLAMTIPNEVINP
jgi:hypothetical protein